MQMDINGHDTRIKTMEVLDFKVTKQGYVGKIYKVEKPHILWIKVDPWNSELHQFETHEEAVKMLAEISK
jgi:hypothetical protein